MKAKLTEAQRELFRKIGALGGKSGDRARKSASAKARWAKAKEEKNLTK